MKRFISLAFILAVFFCCNASAWCQESGGQQKLGEQKKTDPATDKLYSELRKNFSKALESMPPFVQPALGFLVVAADFGDKLSDEDKKILDETGKTFLRAWYANVEAQTLLANKANIKDADKVARIRELTSKILEATAKIRANLNTLGRKLSVENLGMEYYVPDRFKKWEGEVEQEQKDDKK